MIICSLFSLSLSVSVSLSLTLSHSLSLSLSLSLILPIFLTLIQSYSIFPGAPFEMPIAHLDRKQLMLKLAEPRRGMFEDIRKTAYDILTADFQWFKKSPEYRGFAELMREQKISLEKCKS
jgi:hypothetical protein